MERQTLVRMTLCKALKILLRSLKPVRGSLIKNSGRQSKLSLAVENELVDKSTLNSVLLASTVCKSRETKCGVFLIPFLVLLDGKWKNTQGKLSHVFSKKNTLNLI